MTIRKITAMALSVFLIAAICGCASGPKAEEQSSDPALPDLAAAMAGEKPIKFHPWGALPCEVTVDALPAAFNADADESSLWQFAVIDLDGDDRSEAVLQIAAPAGDLGGFVVVYWYDGELRGFPVDYRYFEDLKTDGSFFFTVTDNMGWGVGKMEFQVFDTSDGYSIGHTLWQEPLYEPERWYDGEKEVFQSDFEDAIRRQREKPDAPWYPYSPEGIASAFSG